MMRYEATRDCTDFDGAYYERGQIVELGPGRHSVYLTPIDPETEEAPGLKDDAGIHPETEEAQPKKTARRKTQTKQAGA